MEDRKLLDTHLRVGQQETSNSIVTSILVTWIFEISVSMCYCLAIFQTCIRFC